jgi:hypothetical protein
LMHYLESTVTNSTSSPLSDTMYVIDGNAQFQALPHSHDTFEDFAYDVFRSLPKCNVVHFVTDTYKDKSIKELEGNRRGSGDAMKITGAKQKLPRDLKSFMLNVENKRQLIQLILQEWQTDRYAQLLVRHQIFFVCEENCYCLESYDGTTVQVSSILDLSSTQEEADTRIILHCFYAARDMPDNKVSVIVRSPDTDVFILLVAYSTEFRQHLLFDTGTGNKRRMLDVKAVAENIGHEVAAALPGLHAFTGCDTTSAFVRKGKKGPFKLLQRHPKFTTVFQELGTTPNTIPDSCYLEIERFVCLMYGRPSYADINKARCDIFQSRYVPQRNSQTISITNGIDLSLLPPCRAALYKHISRVNYQTRIWKHAHIAKDEYLPHVTECGWKEDVDGNLTIDWTNGDLMPPQLADILAESESLAERETACEENEQEQFEISEEYEVDNIIYVIFDEEECDQ